MKIDTTGKPLPTSSLGEGATRASNKATATPQQPSSSASTSVSLGSTATQLHKLDASIATSSGVDAKKVAEIKQAISEGRFQVNAGMVADRLIEGVRELIGGRA